MYAAVLRNELENVLSAEPIRPANIILTTIYTKGGYRYRRKFPGRDIAGFLYISARLPSYLGVTTDLYM